MSHPVVAQKTAVDDSIAFIKANAENDLVLVEQLAAWADQVYDSQPAIDCQLNREIAQICLAQRPFATPRNQPFARHLSVAYDNIGMHLQSQGVMPRALEYFEKNRTLLQELDREVPGMIAATDQALALNSIGTVHADLRQCDLALQYFEAALAHAQLDVDTPTVATIVNNIAYLHAMQVEKLGAGAIRDSVFHLSQTNYQQTLQLSMLQKDTALLAEAYNNIGGLYRKTGDIATALDYFNKGLQLHRQLNLLSGKSYGYANVGDSYLRLGDTTLAKRYADSALAIATELDQLAGIAVPAELLYKVQRAQGNWRQALLMHELFHTLRDSLHATSNRRAALEQSANYQYEKRSLADSLRAAERQHIQVLRAEQAELKQWWAFGGFIAAGLIALVVFNRFRVTASQKRIIQGQASELELKNDIIAADFRNLKQFTENAAHELQTPMAIIQSKTELLLQNPHLGAQELRQVSAIYAAGNRMSRLNRSLLLLSRIENRQFQTDERIDFSVLVRKQVDWVGDIAEGKGLTIDLDVQDNISKLSHTMLAETLVSNLLKNAIRHNVADGQISIRLSAETLEVSNSGKPLQVAPETLFERFKKAEIKSEGSGLGLAIIKQVCEVHRWDVRYLYQEKKHTLRVNFAA